VEDVAKACRRVNMVENYVLTYENRKMRPVETILRMEEGMKKNNGMCEFNEDIL
jgi:hypothetical protein